MVCEVTLNFVLAVLNPVFIQLSFVLFHDLLVVHVNHEPLVPFLLNELLLLLYVPFQRHVFGSDIRTVFS